LIRDGAELLGGVWVSNPQKRRPEWPETKALFLLRQESSASYFLFFDRVEYASGGKEGKICLMGV